MRQLLRVLRVAALCLCATTVFAGKACGQSVVENNPFRNQRGDIVDQKAWHKHRVLNTCAWTSLGTGATMLVAGTVMYVCAANSSEDLMDNTTALTGLVMIIPGAVLSGVSVPLFIASHHMRKKAYKLSLQPQATTIPTAGGGRKCCPMLGLSLAF